MLGANQAVMLGLSRGGGGGIGYLASCIRAYEYDETSSPVVDSISSYEAVLGSAMTLSGGILSTTITDSAVNKAVTNDTVAHLTLGNPFSFEIYVLINAGASTLPSLCTFKTSESNGIGLFPSSITAYQEFYFGGSGVVGVRINAGTSYSTDHLYHIVVCYDGGTIGDESNYTIWVDGTKYVGTSGSAISPFTNENAIGWNVATTQSASDHRYLRVYDECLSDSDAGQLYTDRDEVR